MNLADRIKSFELLGQRLIRFHENSTEPGLSHLVAAARSACERNPWFTGEHVRIALNNLGMALERENLDFWLSAYDNSLTDSAIPWKIGVVMAGNIPAVGFHDFLCVLISGHKLLAKLSSSDNLLLPAMTAILTDIMPEWEDHISFTSGKLENFDAIIATGSNNTSRYFQLYFSKYPHIIRKNRNSLAVLNGNESKQDLQNLASDIMLFFGMGCRSVSKLFVPYGYDFSRFLASLESYSHFAHHHKYRNNYDYNKSIFMVSQIPFIDNGFLMLKEDPAIAARIGLVNYEYYQDPVEVAARIRKNHEEIQCVVSNMDLQVKSLNFGEAQQPALGDYADEIDTMEFLLSLNR